LSAIKSGFPAIALIVFALAADFRWSARSRLAFLYFATCSVTALTAGKLGSDSNHLLEWFAALCVMGGLAGSYLFDKARPAGKTVLTLLLPAALAATVRFGNSPYDMAQWKCGEAYEYVQSSPAQRILAEDLAPLVLGGKPVLVSNPFVTTQLANAVSWSRGSIEQLVAGEYFDLILLSGPVKEHAPDDGRWSLPLLQSIGSRYTLQRQFPGCPSLGAAYAPKPR
jgi:hypothetical protein